MGVEPPRLAGQADQEGAVRPDGGRLDKSGRLLGVLTAIATTMAAAAIAALVLTGMQSNAIYSRPVDRLLAERTRFLGRPVRVEGILVHGSLEKRDQPCEYRFVIADHGSSLPVRFDQCVVPDTFRDVPGMDVGVTVEGQLRPDNTFDATSVLAKCPSKYEMRRRRQNGEAIPHGPLASWAPSFRAKVLRAR